MMRTCKSRAPAAEASASSKWAQAASTWLVALVVALVVGIGAQPLVALADQAVEPEPAEEVVNTPPNEAVEPEQPNEAVEPEPMEAGSFEEIPQAGGSEPEAGGSEPENGAESSATEVGVDADAGSAAGDPSPLSGAGANQAEVTTASSSDSTVPSTQGAADTQNAAEAITLAVTGDTVDQCNNTGITGADTITCTVTITNNCTYNPATPNQPTCETTVVTEILCTGSAVCPTGETLILTEPITVVTQCNNAGTGEASTVTCTVTVTNNLTGYPIGSAIDSTVLQCQDPAAVGTLTCTATPPGDDRTGDGGPGGQAVTQCNSSGGPGGTMTCTVTAPPSQSTGLPTMITQCVESGTEGASTVTCTATITNNFFDSIPGDGGGPGGGGPGGGGPGGGGPGGGGPGGGGPGGGGPGGPGDGTPGSSTPGSGTPGSGTPGSSTPGSGTPGSSTPGSGTPGGGHVLPFTGLDIALPGAIAMVMLLLGAGLRRLRPGDAPAAAQPTARR